LGKSGFTTAGSISGEPVAFIVTFFCSVTASAGLGPSSIRIKTRDFLLGRSTRCVPLGSVMPFAPFRQKANFPDGCFG
jgi:hypothetical protein